MSANKSILLSRSSNPTEVVPSYHYLGCTVSDDCSTDAEVASYINVQSFPGFHSLSGLLWYQNRINPHTKLWIFNCIIMSTLLHGVEIAVLHETLVHHLQTCHALTKHHLRCICVGKGAPSKAWIGPSHSSITMQPCEMQLHGYG